MLKANFVKLFLVVFIISSLNSCQKDSDLTKPDQQEEQLSTQIVDQAGHDNAIKIHDLSEAQKDKAKATGLCPDIGYMSPSSNSRYVFERTPISFVNDIGYYAYISDLWTGFKVKVYLDGVEIDRFENLVGGTWSFNSDGTTKDIMLNPGQHKLKVKATNYFVFGLGQCSDEKTHTFTVVYNNPVPTPPPAPSNFTINGGHGDHPHLTWSSSSGANGYRIYKKTYVPYQTSLVATISSTSWTDYSERLDMVNHDGRVNYSIEAYNEVGASHQETEVCFVQLD